MTHRRQLKSNTEGWIPGEEGADSLPFYPTSKGRDGKISRHQEGDPLFYTSCSLKGKDGTDGPSRFNFKHELPLVLGIGFKKKWCNGDVKYGNKNKNLTCLFRN